MHAWIFSATELQHIAETHKGLHIPFEKYAFILNLILSFCKVMRSVCLDIFQSLKYSLDFY